MSSENFRKRGLATSNTPHNSGRAQILGYKRRSACSNTSHLQLPRAKELCFLTLFFWFRTLYSCVFQQSHWSHPHFPTKTHPKSSPIHPFRRPVKSTLTGSKSTMSDVLGSVLRYENLRRFSPVSARRNGCLQVTAFPSAGDCGG